MISTTGDAKGFAVRLALIATIALVAAPARSAAAAEPLDEHWYQVLLGDAPAGWMVIRQTAQGTRRITESSTRLEVGRGGQGTRLEMASRFVELADGTPVEAWARQVLGPQPIETTYRFADGKVEVTTTQGDRTHAEDKPPPAGAWLAPVRAQAALAAAVAAGDTEILIRSLDPLLGLQVVETSWRRIGQGLSVTVPAGDFEVGRYEQRMSATPGLVATVDLDADAELVASTTPFMGMSLRFVRADRATATAAASPPELLVASFVYPDRRLEQPRSLRRASFRLRLDDGAAPALPSTGAQHAERQAGATLVHVDLDTPPEVAAADLDATPYLVASTFLDHRHASIRRLAAAARDAAGSAADVRPAARAEALRQFVRGHLEAKNLDSLLATAVEVAASRAGDCTEHSVLLAALLRAENIPSRVVTGLVYVDHFAGASDLFGFHMWTQALVDGRWRDLDASFAQPFDAAHIAFGTSALADDQAALVDLAAIVPMIGRLRIEVVETAR